MCIRDSLRTGNYKDTLLIVNEVIEKGFDGQHFITGMGEHLRNLLMSIDATTVKLIETSDAIRAKYSNQARTVSMQLLIDSLDIINKCDITYRTSNNKRLALEVPLIQICRLSVQMQMQPGIQPQVSQTVAVSEPKPSETTVLQPRIIAAPAPPVVAPAPVAAISEPCLLYTSRCV